EKLRQAGAGVNAEVAVALGADIEVLRQVLLPDNLAALVALHPQALGAHFLFARGVQLSAFALKPSHKNQLSVASGQWPKICNCVIGQLETRSATFCVA